MSPKTLDFVGTRRTSKSPKLLISLKSLFRRSPTKSDEIRPVRPATDNGLTTAEPKLTSGGANLVGPMRPFNPPATDAARRHRPLAQGCRQRAVQSSPCCRRPRPRRPPAACAVRCRSLRSRPTGCRRRGLPASGASKWRWRAHRQTPAPSGRPCRPTRARPVAHDGCHRCPRPRRPDSCKGMPGARFHGQGVACGVDEVSRGGERGGPAARIARVHRNGRIKQPLQRHDVPGFSRAHQ